MLGGSRAGDLRVLEVRELHSPSLPNRSFVILIFMFARLGVLLGALRKGVLGPAGEGEVVPAEADARERRLEAMKQAILAQTRATLELIQVGLILRLCRMTVPSLSPTAPLPAGAGRDGVEERSSQRSGTRVGGDNWCLLRAPCIM